RMPDGPQPRRGVDRHPRGPGARRSRPRDDRRAAVGLSGSRDRGGRDNRAVPRRGRAILGRTWLRGRLGQRMRRLRARRGLRARDGSSVRHARVHSPRPRLTPRRLRRDRSQPHVRTVSFAMIPIWRPITAGTLAALVAVTVDRAVPLGPIGRLSRWPLPTLTTLVGCYVVCAVPALALVAAACLVVVA